MTVTHQDRGLNDFTIPITTTVAAQSRRDEATRVIRLDYGPIIEMDPAYKRDRRFRVTHLKLSWTRGALDRVVVSGPVLKADGSNGLREQHTHWFVAPRTGTWHDTPPVWVMELIDRFGEVPTWDETA